MPTTLLTTHELSCDVLIAGGGPAGVPCALAAARNGAKVILCQDRPVLGGNASSEVRMHIVGANAMSFRGKPLETEPREGGIIEEVRIENSVRNPQRSPSMMDLILYDLCRVEPNITLMLNTTVVGVELMGGRITHALAERQSTEDRYRIAADVFVDCTGDGRLGAEAGAAFMEGRESKEQFHERLAQDHPDNQRLGSTLLFMGRRHDKPMPFVAPSWARKFKPQDLHNRLHATPGEEAPSLEYGYWWVEWGGTLDTIKQNETIRDELLAIVMGIWDYIKNGPEGTAAGTDPFKASHWALDWFGFLPGKRESRRFIGRRVLTEQDVFGSTPFRDAIAFGGWPVDTHPPRGIDAPDEEPCTQHHVEHLYDIPLSCCVARDIPNLMFAGRNISATHVAFASTRVMATCAVVGQGVGIAAAHAVRNKLDPRNLPDDTAAVHAIQQRLLRDDAYLIGVAHDDHFDLAKAATITASSEQPGGEAINVVSGQTRAVHGPHGAPPARDNPGTHRWMSHPTKPLPAWIELRWGKPIRPATVQLIFDTGMHRHLTLTQHDGYAASMLWGRGQPEVVRDYALLIPEGDRWRSLMKVVGNYQRRRVHTNLDCPMVMALRIECRQTHGLDHARICEVRVYE